MSPAKHSRYSYQTTALITAFSPANQHSAWRQCHSGDGDCEHRFREAVTGSITVQCTDLVGRVLTGFHQPVD